jgi:hypothetical protein
MLATTFGLYSSRNAPISVMDALMTATPNALLQKDASASGPLLPLPVATRTQCSSVRIKRLLQCLYSQ